MVDQSEQIISHVNKFQDKVIVQGSENISTQIERAHQEFFQEQEELEKNYIAEPNIFTIFPIYLSSTCNEI